MSSSDKVKKKLMETMRMTKADSSKKVEDVDTKKNVPPQNEKPIIEKKKIIAPKKVAIDTQQSSADSYWATRRVWPD